MNISDFLPKYPNINQEDEDLLNPYDDFYNSIFQKKEFYDERYIEDLPPEVITEKGMLLKHQKLVARFLSSNTMYDSLLLVHEMGSGKTCCAIGAIEQIKNEQNNFKGAYIFAKGTTLLDNFVKELRDKCTGGQYVPEGFVEREEGGRKKYGELTEREAVIRTKKLYEEYYHFKVGNNKPTTFETFSNHISRMSDNDIIKTFSNHIIVIDEVHNLREGKEGDEKMYEQFHKFLHLIKNCKILLLSGTPMKDSPEEIASVINLILPLDNQLPTGTDFINQFLIKKGNVYRIKNEKINEFKSKFKGRVSFVKAIRSNVRKEFIGDKIGGLKHLVVQEVKMSEFQTKNYIKAVELDAKGKIVEDESKKTGVHYNARQASLFVFPDGSFGGEERKGFNKYVIKTEKTKAFLAAKAKGNIKQKSTFSYKLHQDLLDELTGKDNEEILQKLDKFSSKYAHVIRSILNAKNQCCFIYSDLVKGSGSILFSKILELFKIDGKNFTLANGSEKTEGIRYALLTSEILSSKKIERVISMFNRNNNMTGNYIKVLIGSKVVSEGVSFFNIQQEYIMTPWFNYSETDQAIARGYRMTSHKALLEAGENPILHVSQMVSVPKTANNPELDAYRPFEGSVDLYMYKLSEDKDVTIQGILRLLMETAFDCSLNYYRNHFEMKDGERDCEYQDCEYKCDGVNMEKIIQGLKPEDVDNSTFQLYYSNPRANDIRKKLDKLFKKYNELDFETIVKNLENEHTEQEIRNALSTLIKQKGDNLLLEDYNKIYATSNVKKIINLITLLFQTNFKLNFDRIVELVGTEYFIEYEIITALKTIIDENIVIKNKYGFSSYLRESKNIYFLVDGLSVKSTPFSEYYSKTPIITHNKLFEDVLTEIQDELIPKFVKKLAEITSPIAFSRLIKAFPEEVQELFIESAILSRKKGIELTSNIRNFIFEYFVNYIHEIDKGWVSNRLNDGETLRCLNPDTDEWKNCDESFDKKLKEKESVRKNVLENNPLGYYGKWNPEKQTFNIVNVKEQLKKKEEAFEKIKQEVDELVSSGQFEEADKESYLQELKESGDYMKDARNVFSGKNCNSWSKSSLQKMVIITLEIDPPMNFGDGMDEEKLKKEVKNIKGISAIYDLEAIDKLDSKQLKRALFWMNKKNKIDELCKAIKNWFETNEWEGVSMLIPDNQAGSYGHKKKESKEEKEMMFKVKTIIPENSLEEFKKYSKSIEKLMGDCFGLKNYKVEIDSKRWILVFKKTKLILALTLDSKNILSNVCIDKNYRKQEIASMAIETALGEVCLEATPQLLVDNRGNTYDKLIKMYTEYGFTIISNDGKVTTMEFKCKK